MQRFFMARGRRRIAQMKKEKGHVFAFLSALFRVFCGQSSEAGGKPESKIPWRHWEHVATSLLAMP
jgi:hypothetical protein